MSVTTQAERTIENVIEDITESIKGLFEVISEEATGYENFTDSYKNKIKNALSDLIDIKDNLK